MNNKGFIGAVFVFWVGCVVFGSGVGAAINNHDKAKNEKSKHVITATPSPTPKVNIKK